MTLVFCCMPARLSELLTTLYLNETLRDVLIILELALAMCNVLGTVCVLISVSQSVIPVV